MKEVLTLVAVLLMLSASTTLAQDLCDDYYDKHRVCIEKDTGGRSVDYAACADYTDSNTCAANDCYWNEFGTGGGQCVMDICLEDGNFDGFIDGDDLNILKREYGRYGCPTTPDVPAVPHDIICEGTLSALGRWCDNDNGTVTDMTTGLVWLQKADWGETRAWEGCETETDDAHTRTGILEEGTSGAGLSDGSVEGDWRLPTKNELMGIAVGNEYIRHNQMYFFTGVDDVSYWSSTSWAEDTNHAWTCNGGYGCVHYDKINDDYVWPVRGGGNRPDVPAPVPKTGQTTSYAAGDDGDLEKGVVFPSPRFTDNGNGTVTDNLTGLLWLKDAGCFGQLSWSDALSVCNSLAAGENLCTSGTFSLTDGSSTGDWRLPNRFELESLLDLEYSNPAVPNTAGTGKWTEGDPFTNVQSLLYWSSTTKASYSLTGKWNVHMYEGSVNSNDWYHHNYVWPVRGGND